MTVYVNARKEIGAYLANEPIPHKIEDIVTIYFNHDEQYPMENADFLKVLEDLKFGFSACPF